MKLFIDTAEINEIKEINSWGVISGVTTNPSLIAKSGRDLEEVLLEIVEIVDGPISAEVIGTTAEEMVEEGVKLSEIHPNIVIKIPMTEEGLKSLKEFNKRDIKTNVTLIFSAQQALLAARAGATYVSPFIGRVEDIGYEGTNLIGEIARLFEIFDIETEIIAASLRNPKQVLDSALMGADIGTIPYGVFKKMLSHPMTDIGLADFLKDWEESQK